MRRYLALLFVVAACKQDTPATAAPHGPGSNTARTDAGSTAMVAPTGPLSIVDLSVGRVILSDGRLRGWGHPTATARELGRIPNAVQVDDDVVVTRDGRALALQWTDGTISATTPIDVPAVRRVVVPELSGGTVYFIGTDGTLTGTDRHYLRDPRIAKLGLKNIVDVVTEDCALDAAGAVHCWVDTVETVQGLPPSKQLVSFASTVCSVAREGGIQCWRTNHRGGPQPIAGFEKATAAAASMRYHVSPGTGLLCAIVEGGAVSCATIGETGPGVSKDHIDTPKLVAGIRNATRIAVARDSACALAGNEVRCWGANNRGQLGDGTRIDRPEPVVVENLLSDTLPTPRDGNDAVPESNVKMSWDGIPAACKRSPSFNFDRARFEKPEIVFEVRSAYAWEWNGKLQIRLANYQVDPVREVAEPRGLQQYIVMTLEKNDKHEKPLRPDRGTYAIGDTARKLSLYRRTMDTDSFVTQGDQEVELTHLDKQWVCGVFRYPDRNDNPIVSTFAARVIAVKR